LDPVSAFGIERRGDVGAVGARRDLLADFNTRGAGAVLVDLLGNGAVLIGAGVMIHTPDGGGSIGGGYGLRGRRVGAGGDSRDCGGDEWLQHGSRMRVGSGLDARSFAKNALAQRARKAGVVNTASGTPGPVCVQGRRDP